MKAAFVVLGFVSLLLGAGVFVTGCDNGDDVGDDEVDPTKLPQACLDLIELCNLCT